MPVMEQETEYLTVKQVATKLGESESNVRAWIYREELRGYKFGKKLKVKKTDLETFIESKEFRKE